MAAAPLCSACLSGSIHSGTPTGKEEVIHGLSTYIATPGDGAEPRALIVMIPDAFGWKMVNNRLLCDTYAKKGRFLVYLPDFMNGEKSRSLIKQISQDNTIIFTSSKTW